MQPRTWVLVCSQLCIWLCEVVSIKGRPWPQRYEKTSHKFQEQFRWTVEVQTSIFSSDVMPREPNICKSASIDPSRHWLGLCWLKQTQDIVSMHWQLSYQITKAWASCRHKLLWGAAASVEWLVQELDRKNCSQCARKFKNPLNCI